MVTYLLKKKKKTAKVPNSGREDNFFFILAPQMNVVLFKESHTAPN